MNQIKPSKFALAVAAATLLIAAGSATTVAAQTYTYYFTANAGQSTDLNGSSITIENNGGGSFSVLGFNFIDTPLTGSPFTSAEETVPDITSANSSTWAGEFTAYYLTGNSSQIAFADSDFLGISPADTTSANGIWSAAAPGVPDASSTFFLLLGSLSVIAGAARSIQSRNAARL